MALNPFDGELDKDPPGAKPFTGLLDGEEASTTAGDVAKSFGQGLAEGVGLPLQFGGGMVAQAINRGARAIGLPDPELRATNPLQGVVDYLDRSKTAGGRAAVERSTPSGDILDPSTYSLGEDPSIGGYMQNVARVVGQFGVPVGVGAAGAALKASDRVMDVAGAASGVAQAGGAAMGAEGARIRGMPEPELLATSPRYAELVASGMDAATARERIAQDTELAAGTVGAIPAAIEGPIIQRLLRGRALLPTAGKSAVARVATAGVAGAAGEAVQESAETMAQNLGANIGTGGDRDLTDDTFASAVLGAAGGKVAGAGIQALRELDRGTKGSTGETDKPPEKQKLFPFQSEAAATKRAAGKTETTGEPYVVIPHPEREGRFAVIPQSEVEKFTPQATDAMLAELDKQGRRDIAAMRDFSQQTPSDFDSEPKVVDPSRVVADVNVARKRPLGPSEEVIVRRIADGEFGEVQGLTVEDLVERGIKKGTAIALLKPVKAAMRGKLARQQAIPGATPLDLKAHEAASSPANARKEPSKAQIEANNAKLGHLKLQGFGMSVENAEGSIRRDIKNDPPRYETLMKAHYGRIKGTKGADGQEIDFFLKPGTPEDHDGPVFVIDQVDPGTGKFDEHKLMFGYESSDAAAAGYLENYEPDWKGLGAITGTTADDVRTWIEHDNTSRAFGDLKEGGNARTVEDGGRAAGAAPASQEADARVGAAQPADADRREQGGAPAGEPRKDAEAGVAKKRDKAQLQLARKALRAHESAPPQLRDVVKRVGASMAYALRKGISWESAETAERAIRKAGEGTKAILYLREHLGIAKPGTERRADAATRKRVADMTPDERAAALLTDARTGLGNDRAYEESTKRPVQASIDADSLKYVNDNLGHDAGNELLRAIGTAIKDEGVDGYRIGGDEFVAQFDTQAEADAALQRVRARLAAAEVTAVGPDGTRITKKGVAFSYGLGKDLSEADIGLRADKAARERSGERAARGEEPAGVVREPAVQAGPDRSEAPAAPAAEDVKPPEKTPAQAGVSASATSSGDPNPQEEYASVIDDLDDTEIAALYKGAKLKGAKTTAEKRAQLRAADEAVMFPVYEAMADAGELPSATDAPDRFTPEEDWDYTVAQFKPPAESVWANKVAGKDYITPEEAAKRLAEWKAEAKRIGREEDHSNEVIISLFDATGEISKPWREAGYDVRQYDIKLGDDLIESFPMGDILEIRESGKKVAGVIAQPPCTCFTNSGARWWKVRHDKHDRDMVAKMFGPGAARYFSKPKEYTRALVSLVDTAIGELEPGFFAMENPAGRIATEMGLPKYTLKFDPSVYGDPYTKETQLWGRFNTALPTANVAPTKGSLMHKLWSSAEKEGGSRSVTPTGFAYAFFMANHTSKAAKPAQVPAVRQQLFVQRGAERFPVDSLEDASRKWDAARTKLMQAGGHSSDAGPPPIIVDQDGKEVARISWNGKVWPPGEWHSGMKPLVGEPFKTRTAEEIDKDRIAAGVAPLPAPWQPIGQNAAGAQLFEDSRGVRSYVEDGVRQTEAVAMRPDGTFAIDRRADRYKTADELPAAPPVPLVETAQETQPKPSAGGRIQGVEAPQGAPSEIAGERDVESVVQPPRGVVGEPRAPAAAESDAAGDMGSGQAGEGAGSGSGEFALTAPGELRPRAEQGRGPRGRESAPRAPRATRARGSPAQVSLVAENFRITDELDFRGVGAKSKFKNNVAAIELLKRLEAESRVATPAEQSILARYVGWGGMPQAFDGKNKTWGAEFAQLEALLTADEYAAARRSTQDAHYTSKEIVTGLWSAVERMGFTGGAVLEPSMGTGNFFGLMPQKWKAALRGVELDSLTGRIAKQLYPNAEVTVAGFNEVRIAPESFDLVVGNPPFGNQSIHDPQYKDLSKLSIHNFFFAKAIESTRPGGVVAMVVSNYFLDAQSMKARAMIAGKAKLLGAIRLPNNAFLKNAGTEVTTDIIFLQRLAEGEKGNPADWVQIGSVPDPAGGEAIPVNRYFVAHPEMMLGDMKREGSQYAADTPALIAREGADIAQALAEAVGKLPENVITPPTGTIAAMDAKANKDIASPEHLKPYNHFIEGGKLFIKTGGLNGVESGATAIPMEGRSLERMQGMIEVRDAVRAQLALEASEASDRAIEGARRDLNRVYDAFVKKNGLINLDANKRLIRVDADFPLLISLETRFDKGLSREVAKKAGATPREASAGKADIFTKRVIFPSREVTEVSSAKEAMLVSLNEKGHIDLPFMSGLYGKDAAAIVAELGDMVFERPEGGYAPQDEYLSGNVKRKLEEARAAAAKDGRFVRNVLALEGVQPKDIPPTSIFLRIGTGWIPPSDYDDFARETFEGTFAGTYMTAVGRWAARISSSNDALNRTKWGTDRAPATSIMDDLINNAPIAVYDKAENDKRVLNAEATAAAQGKAEALEEAFQAWIWKDPERRERLGRVYNDRFNTDVERKYDGSHLTLPGTARTVTLRPHQLNMIYRGLQSGVLMADHVVGAGKTFAFGGLAVEGRRIGIHRKPMITVPNHLVEQWAAEIKRLYPGSNVLAASRKDFAKAKRAEMFARIATGDWDAVIVAHKSFGFIPMPAQAEADILAEQMAELEMAIEAQRATSGKKDLSVKQLEKLRDKIKSKIAGLADRKRDTLIDFAEMGVDALFVDEAHEFKNLFFSTQMRGVAGLGSPEGSVRAFDMFVKSRYLMQRNGNRGIYFATGTPVSNSIAEVFHMQRYLQYHELKSRGIHTFDAWAGTFGQAVSDWEMDAAGRYKQKTRFSKFANLGELRTIWRGVTDTITAADLERDAQKQGKRFPIPRVAGGKPTNVVVERSPLQAEYIGIARPVLDEAGNPKVDENNGQELTTYDEGTIIDRLEHWTQRVKDDPREMPLVITGQARKAGLDYRLIDENAPDFAGSKVNTAVGKIEAIWRDNDHRKGTQLVFIDLSTPKAHKGKATAAAAAKVPSFFIQDQGTIRHVQGVKTVLATVPEDAFFSWQDGGRYHIHDAVSGMRVGVGKTKQDAIDLANEAIAKRGPEGFRELSQKNAIPQDSIDAYIAAWEEKQASQEDQAEEGEQEGAAEVSMDELIADQGGNFSVYDDMRAKLIAKGVPAEQIAFIHDHETDIQKARLFDSVNAGAVRIVFGSTAKMGAGTNVQRKLVALHHLDAPWRPSDLEQREGRIIRQGNEFYEADPDGFEVQIYRYATKQTYDARQWEIIETKASAIEQFKAGTSREIEDISSQSANAADMKAGASGNPKILEEIALRQQIKKLEAQAREHTAGRHALQDIITKVKRATGYPWNELDAMVDARAAAAPAPKEGEPLGLTIAGTKYKTRKDLPIQTIAAELISTGDKADSKGAVVGSYRGFPIHVTLSKFGTNWKLDVALRHENRDLGGTAYNTEDKFTAAGFLQRLDNIVDRIPENIRHLEERIARMEREAKEAAVELEKPFAKAAELVDLKAKHAEVLQALRATSKAKAKVAEPEGDVAKASRPYKRLITAENLPVWTNEEITLATPRLAETQPIDRATQRIAYDVLDTPTLKAALREFGQERAQARAKVGEVLVDIKNGEFSAFYNIKILDEHQGKGHGRAAVAAMLMSQDTPMRIIDIQESAVGFWVKMGAQFPRSLDYMEAMLDRFQYTTYNRRRGNETRSQAARADDAGGEARAGGEAEGGADDFDLDFTKGKQSRGATRAFRGFTRVEAPPRAGLSVSGVQRAVSGLRQGWNNAPPIVVLENPSEVDFELSPDAHGAFYRGRVYLFADNLTSEAHAQFTALHETVGHFGLLGALGPRLEPVMGAIYRTNASIRVLADQWMASNPRQEGQTLEAYQALAAEEALSDLAGTGLIREQGFWKWLATAIRRALRSMGFSMDVSDTEVATLLADAKRFVENDPSMVTQGRLEPAASRETAPGPIFYSELERQLERGPNAAPAAQWMAFIANLKAKGVKQDEIDWTGVMDWLGAQPGKVTRDQVLGFLEQNGVKVEEVMLGDDGSATSEHDQLVVELDALGFTVETAPDPNTDEYVLDGLRERATRQVWAYVPGEGFEEASEDDTVLPERVRAIGERLAALEMEMPSTDGGGDPTSTKFSRYTLPGGQNYRELLLTLPNRARELGIERRGSAWVIVDKATGELADMAAFGSHDQAAEVMRDVAVKKGRGAEFRSSHFDTPNILAHVRFNERTDAEGKRVLFIEEFQSDWAQMGKREGFGLSKIEWAEPRQYGGNTIVDSTTVADLYIIDRGGGNVSLERDGQVIFDGEVKTIEEAKALAQGKAYTFSAKGVPPAPFVGKTEAWVGLAVKRMIRYAAENGFDRVAWTTGEQQADRYNLSKVIGTLAILPLTDVNGRLSGSYSIDAWAPGVTPYGREMPSITRVAKEADLADVIGKELADKAIRKAHEQNNGGLIEFRNPDLKIGGEGMVAFYDRIVPNVVNDALKKLGGGRAGKVTLDLTEQPPEGAGFRRAKPSEQLGFDITPAMRAAALAGQPRMSRGFDFAAIAPQLQAKMNDLMTTQRKFNWWHRTIGTQYHKATINREFRPVFEASQRFVQDVSLIATEAADLAPSLLPKLASLTQTAADFFNVKGTRDHQADVKAVAKAVYQGTLKDTKVYTRAELGNLFALTERQKDLYFEFRASVDRSLNLLAISEMGQLARGYGKQDPMLAAAVAKAKETADPTEALGIYRRSLQDWARSQPPAYQAEIAKTVNTLELVVERVQQLQAEGYAPLMRFGQHYVYFYTQAKNGDRETQYFALHESERDANADFRRMSAEFAKDPKVQSAHGLMAEDSFKLFKGVNPETLSLFADALGVGDDPAKQAFLRLAISQRSALKRMIHRKGVGGFSDDVSRTLASFITSNARLASKNYHMGDLKEATDAVKAGDVKDDAVALMEYLEDPKEEAAKFRGFLFIQYLGGSAAAALVNATQPVTMSFPYLAQFTSTKDAAAQLARGAKVALGKGSVDEETRVAMKRAAEEGVTEPAEIHQLYAESIRGFGSNIFMRRFLRLWGSAFQLAESFNRKTTFAAAYEIGRKMARERGGAFDPYAFAVKAVHETQGIYNRANRPNWARGTIGSTIFTFKQFSISYLEFLRRLPRKQQALALAVLMLAAGIQGLPGADDLDDIIDSFAESLGYNFSSERAKHAFIAESLGLGKGVADWLLYGASTIPGMPLDVQARMGLGNLIPGTGFLKKSQPNKGRDAIEIFGPAGGLLQSAIDAFSAIQGGRVGAAAETIAPVAVKNVVKAGDMLAQGAYRDTRGRRVIETDAIDAAVKATGFQPANVAAEQRAIGRAMPAITLARVTESEIAAAWAEGVFERDPEKVARARERLASWNEKNPETPIRIQQSQIRRRVREMVSLKRDRIVRTAPKDVRGEVAKNLER